MCTSCPVKPSPLTISSSLSAVRLRALYRFSSDDESSPVSSFSCWSFWSSGILNGEMIATRWEFGNGFREVYGSLFLTSPCYGSGCVKPGRTRGSRWLPCSWHTALPPSDQSGGSSLSVDRRRCYWEHTLALDCKDKHYTPKMSAK